MTADWARIPYGVLRGDLEPGHQRDPGVNRVVYDVLVEAAGDDQ